MRPLATMLLLVALAGCAAVATPTPRPVAPPEAYFPRHESPLGTGDQALLEGAARFEDGCIWLQTSDGTRYLPLWPADTELGTINSQPAIFAPNGGPLFEVGDAFDDTYGLGGSETTAATARELVGEIPEACAGGSFWVVSGVLGRP